MAASKGKAAASGFLSGCSVFLAPGVRQAGVFKTLHAAVRMNGGFTVTVEEATLILRKKSQLRVTHVVSGADADTTGALLKKIGAQEVLAEAELVSHVWLQECLKQQSLVSVEAYRIVRGAQAAPEAQSQTPAQALPRRSPRKLFAGPERTGTNGERRTYHTPAARTPSPPTSPASAAQQPCGGFQRAAPPLPDRAARSAAPSAAPDPISRPKQIGSRTSSRRPRASTAATVPSRSSRRAASCPGRRGRSPGRRAPA